MSLSPAAQEDIGDSRKNGTQDHTVVNFTSANTDTIKIHTGKATEVPEYTVSLK